VAADGPLSEYEAALTEETRVLTLTVLSMGANPEVLRGNLEESQQNLKAAGNETAAAAVAQLIHSVFDLAYSHPPDNAP